MSAGIGMEAGQQEAYFAAQTTSQMAEALVNLLRAISGRHTERYSDDFDMGMRIIGRHVDHGGILRQSIMEESDADAFANALRETNIPYVQIQVRNNNDEVQNIFYTRGGAAEDASRDLPDDSSQLEKAWALFTERMMERLKETENIEAQNQERRYEKERSRKHGREVDIG